MHGLRGSRNRLHADNQKESSDDRPPCIENPRPAGAESIRTENVASPFQAEPRHANDTDYGLSASAFSSDVGRALEIARRIESGICHINGPTVHDEPQMPFGGPKGSGYGRFGGKRESMNSLRYAA